MMNNYRRGVIAGVVLLGFASRATADQEHGLPDSQNAAQEAGDLLELKNECFISIFDGKTLDGWTEIQKGAGPSYFVTNGVLASPPNAGNDLVTDRSFADYILGLDFKLTPGANNGVGHGDEI